MIMRTTKKTPSPQFPEFVAVKMTTAMRRCIERAAAAEERSVASFLRRIIASALGAGK